MIRPSVGEASAGALHENKNKHYAEHNANVGWSVRAWGAFLFPHATNFHPFLNFTVAIGISPPLMSWVVFNVHNHWVS